MGKRSGALQHLSRALALLMLFASTACSHGASLPPSVPGSLTGRGTAASSATASPLPDEAGREKTTCLAPMRDGAQLATDIYLPCDYAEVRYPQGVPAVLVRTIYGKDSGNESLERWGACFTGHGYAFVVQDVRGFYASAAAGKAGEKLWDGYDAVEWLAVQRWCNGKVGMIGYSALGAAQYEAAVTSPPHLVCAIPAQAPGNYYTDSYYAPKFRKADYETILRGALSAQTRQQIASRIRSQATSRIGQFQAPMMHSSGWYDFYKEGAIEMFSALQADGGPGARGKQQLIIGPWGHGVLQEEAPGEPLRLPGGMTYPVNAKLDWAGEVWLPWFDYWLKGQATGVMERPPVRYYLMGDTTDPSAPGNRWVEADVFPPLSDATPYYLYQDHTLGPARPAASQASLSYRYDPRDPVPTVGRVNVRLPVTGPYDQRETEDRSDVLVFTTSKLTAPLPIIGQIRARLLVSSDRKDTDFTVKLTDVYPDGRSMIFTDGIVKGRYRNTYLSEEFLTAGQIYEVEVDLGYTAIVLAPGHQLRVAISSSNFDRFDINPNTGEPYGTHATTLSLQAKLFGGTTGQTAPEYFETLVATNTIYLDRNYPSQIILPIVPLAELTK